MNYVRRAYNLLIGERTAEEVKIRIGSAYPLEKELQMDVRGRDLVTGLPKSVVLHSEEIREAIAEPINQIVDVVKLTLEQTPLELAADIMDRGIVLCGGVGLLRGLDKLLRQETGIPVLIAEDPLTCVALGAGRLVEDMDVLTRALNGRIL